jgi:hypothetical protein
MRTTTNIVLDIVITAAFLVAANPSVLGLALHEWFGLAFGAVLIAHLVLHWDWIVTATTRLVVPAGRALRLTYAVDALLLVALTAAVLSGVLISKHAMASLGFAAEPTRGWRGIHSLAANVSVVAIGVHLGLHWNWVAVNLTRLAGGSQKSVAHADSRDEQPATAGASCAAGTR